MTDPLLGVRIKINRSKEHLTHLDSAVQTFKARKPYFVTVDFDSQPGYETYRFREREPIPIAWSAILGDCVHNMRSALDHLACALVIANNCTPTQYTAFPIGSSETHFRTSAIGRIKGASDAAVKLVESLKPYNRGNVLLYRLHMVDIADKHQALIPVAVANNMFGTRTDVRNVHELHIAWRDTLLRKRPPLKDGDEIFSFRRSNEPNFQDNSQFQFGFEIAFGESQVFDREPVIPTLYDLFHMTNGIIERFAAEIFRIRW